MTRRPSYCPGIRERAVRLVLTSKHEYILRRATIQSIATGIGCTPETLRSWVHKSRVDLGSRPGAITDQAQLVKELEREVRELKRANGILRKAGAFFAQAELDRKAK